MSSLAFVTGTSTITELSSISTEYVLWIRQFTGSSVATTTASLCPGSTVSVSYTHLSCAGTELALSRCVAQENAAGHPEKAKELLKTGLIFTFVPVSYTHLLY